MLKITDTKGTMNGNKLMPALNTTMGKWLLWQGVNTINDYYTSVTRDMVTDKAIGIVLAGTSNTIVKRTFNPLPLTQHYRTVQRDKDIDICLSGYSVLSKGYRGLKSVSTIDLYKELVESFKRDRVNHSITTRTVKKANGINDLYREAIKSLPVDSNRRTDIPVPVNVKLNPIIEYIKRNNIKPIGKGNLPLGLYKVIGNELIAITYEKPYERPVYPYTFSGQLGMTNKKTVKSYTNKRGLKEAIDKAYLRD